MSRLHVFVLFVTTVWSVFVFTNSAASQSSGATSSLAIDITASGNRSSAGNTVTTQYFSTPQANELLLAFVSADSSLSAGNTVTSVTGAGLTWQLVARANNQPGDAEIWRAFAPAILSNVTVTASLSQSAAASISVVAFSGADTSGSNGSGAIGASGTFSSAVGAPSGSVVTTRDNSWVFGVGADWDNAIARTAGANQTIVHQYLATVNDTYWVQRQNTASAPSGTTVSINDTAPTGDKYDLAVVEILPATSVTTNPDFGLSVSPSSQSVQPGSTATYTATITGQNGYSGSATLTASGLPTGATATFNPVSTSGSGTSQLTVTTVGSTPAGTYALTITATSGTVSHTAGTTLVVSAAVQHTVALSWTDADSGLAGFNVYRSNQSGTGYSKLNTSLTTSTSTRRSTPLSHSSTWRRSGKRRSGRR